MTLIDDTNTATDIGLWDSIVAVPDRSATAPQIAEFANTFDAYGVHGSLDRISLIANDVAGAHLSGTLASCHLDDLRTALFMTQQGWLRGQQPGERPTSYERELVAAIHHVSGGLVRDDRPTRY